MARPKLYDFSIHMRCDRCGVSYLIYHGPLNLMPFGIQLAEVIAERADLHTCPKPKEP